MLNDERERQLKRIAASRSNVLIQFGSWQEREYSARSLHLESTRKEKPFVVLDCSALRETLLESELFGHEKGSFTGAYTRKIGLLEVANGGTLFLDHVEELTPGIQAKLTRFLRHQEFYRVGGRDPITCDVRIISGVRSDVDLEHEVVRGTFREDLYYLMNSITFSLDKEIKAEGRQFQVVFNADMTIHEIEKRYILSALKHFNGNKTRAAESLGITIKTLYNKLHEYGEFDNFCVKPDPTVLDGEAELRVDGKLVGKITNLKVE